MKLETDDLDDMATGATILGTGGGGDPYIGKLMAKRAIEKHGSVDLIDPSEVPADALVAPTAMLGAPTVLIEKLPNGAEARAAFDALEQYLDDDIFATISVEAGGLNSMIPIVVAASLDIPLVDADGMGRAFPEVPMVTFNIGNINACPISLVDEKGNTVFIEASDSKWAERLSRTTSVEMGGACMSAAYTMTGAQLNEYAIANSMSFCQKIGQTLHDEQDDGGSPIDAVLSLTDGYELFRGKIEDVERRTEGGFAVGSATISGFDNYKDRTLTIEFQNENLVARDSKQGVVATVPDLITVVDAENGDPITTEGLKYGYRVQVIGIPCHELWRTEAGLSLVGPQAFGYDLTYKMIKFIQEDIA